MALVLLKVLIGLFIIHFTSCTIDGLSYMDPLNFRPYQNKANTENPCNPLYWYPKNIPDYCYEKPFINTTKYVPLPVPVPMPPPTPILPPLPMLPMPMLPPVPMPQPIPVPQPVPYSYPLPFPLAPMSPMIPMSLQPSPYTFPQRQIGMVPGLPGIVSPGGGLNILPFSDVYADVLEKHRQKKIQRRMQRVLDDYDNVPWSHRGRKRVRKIFYD